MSVSITFHGENAEHVRIEMATLLGGPLMPAFVPSAFSGETGPQLVCGEVIDATQGAGGKDVEPQPATTEAAPAKGRGRPKKTTLAVITEAGASASTSEPAVETTQPNISTGEERVESVPTVAVAFLSDEDKAKLLAAEAKEKADAEFAKLFAEKSAEFAAAKAAGSLTIDNVRAAATPYVNKHGIVNASRDLIACLEKATGGAVGIIRDLSGKDQATMIAAGEALLAAAAADKRYGQ